MARKCPDCGVDLADGVGRCPLCSTADSKPPARGDAFVGRTVGNRYRITRPIGRGGMGVVYEAELVGVGQRVAVKFLHATFSNDPEVVRRFRNEARSYVQIHHPHAVQLHDFGQDETGNLYIAMEFLDGLDLKRTLDRDLRLSPRDALEVALQVCDVISAAHAQGIVHRDLKPENVMLTPGLRGYHAKVLDFGLAHLADSGSRLTAPGIVCGTPRYMAPEQAEGGTIDHRVDIYALGLVLYEALTGTHPFDAPSVTETLRRQVSEPVPHLWEMRSELAGLARVDAAIQKATAKRREDRFASMADFARELSEEADALPRTAGSPAGKAGRGAEAAAGRPERPIDPTLPSAARRGLLARRRRWGIGLGAAGLGALLAAGIGVAVGTSGPSASELRPALDAHYLANREPVPPPECREGSARRLARLISASGRLTDTGAEAARAREAELALADLGDGIAEASAEGAYLLAKAELVAGRPAEAAAHAAQACRCPGFAAAQHLAGRIAMQDERVDEARKHFSAARALAPGFAKPAYALGVLALQEGDAEAAIEAFEATVAAQPDYAEAHYALARTWDTRARRAGGAAEHAEQVRQDAAKAREAYCRALDLGMREAAAGCVR